MKILLILLLSIWPFNPGRKVINAIVTVEDARTGNPVVWQRTGDEGKVSFRFLDAGNYSLAIELPQMGGKWISQKRKQYVATKATYNPKNKTYYYQGDEGFFAVKFMNLRRIDTENFTPVFREIQHEKGYQYVIAQFQLQRNRGQLSVQIKALTAGQFKRAVEKTDTDISMISIPKRY